MTVTALKKQKGKGTQFEVYVRRKDLLNETITYRRRLWFPSIAAAKRHEKMIVQTIISGQFTAARNARRAKKKEEEEKLSVEEFSIRFLRYCEAEKAESTWYTRRGHFRNHINPAIGGLALSSVTTEHLEELKHEVKSKGLENNSTNRVLETGTAMLSYAKYLRRVQSVPWVKKLPEIDKPIQWLRPKQLRALLSADEMWGRMMLFAVRTGLRRAELRALHWSSIDFVMSQALVQHNAWRGKLKKIPKGKRYRYVPLSQDALLVLKEQKAVSFMRSKFVFPDPSGLLMKETEMYERLHFLCRKVGLPEYGWHAFRHTFGAHATMAGVHPRLLQKWMGHSSLRMTERYAHLAPEQDQAINKLDLLEEQYESNESALISNCLQLKH